MRSQHDGARARRGRIAGVLALVVAVLSTVAAWPAAATPATPRHATGRGGDPVREYVALGDSFAAAPLVLPQVQVDPCLRSGVDYPHVLAGTLRPVVFRDVTCSGATTANVVDTPQRGLLPTDTVAPQVDAVTRRTDLVTVTIGANDVGLAGTALRCLTLVPLGPSCKARLTAGGVDRGAAAVDSVAPALVRTIAAIRHRAPHARIVFTSYARYLPHDGCYPVQPILPADANYVQGLIDRIGRVTARVAAAHGAEYVDFIGPGAGHDGCRLLRNWVTDLVPGLTLGLVPLHPTALGERAFARLLDAHLRAGERSS